MKIFHAILIVLNFLLAIACIAFGYFLFDQREIFKKRLAVMQTHASDMAAALKWGDHKIHLDKELPERFGNWSLERDADEEKMVRDIQDYQRVHLGLKQMEQVASDRVATMISNKEEWDEMDRRLSTTNGVLADTRIERDDWNNKYDDEVDAHDSTKGELQDALAKIQGLEGQILSLQAELTMRDEEIAKRDTEIGKLKVDLEGCYADALSLEEQLRACRTDTDTATGDVIAKVVAYEPQWNFVVINAGRDDAVKESSIALVHRGPKLIGKVNISRVSDEVCIGQILREWITEGESIQPGDGIMFAGR